MSEKCRSELTAITDLDYIEVLRKHQREKLVQEGRGLCS